jgi:hypothetical protein
MRAFMPLPIRKSQRTGLAKVPKERLFSRKNLMNSRWQIIYTGWRLFIDGLP